MKQVLLDGKQVNIGDKLWSSKEKYYIDVIAINSDKGTYATVNTDANIYAYPCVWYNNGIEVCDSVDEAFGATKEHYWTKPDSDFSELENEVSLDGEEVVLGSRLYSLKYNHFMIVKNIDHVKNELYCHFESLMLDNRNPCHGTWDTEGFIEGQKVRDLYWDKIEIIPPKKPRTFEFFGKQIGIGSELYLKLEDREGPVKVHFLSKDELGTICVIDKSNSVSYWNLDGTTVVQGASKLQHLFISKEDCESKNKRKVTRSLFNNQPVIWLRYLDEDDLLVIKITDKGLWVDYSISYRENGNMLQNSSSVELTYSELSSGEYAYSFDRVNWNEF